MMNKFLIIVFLISYGCKKTDKSILNTPEFKELIGIWKPINQTDDDAKKIIIHQDGKIEIYKSIERGECFYMNRFYHDNNQIISQSDTLHDRMCIKEKKSDFFNGITFFKKASSDTARLTIGIKITNFIADTLNGVYFVKQ